MRKLFLRALLFYPVFLANHSYAADSTYLFKEANIKVNVPNSVWHLRPRQEKNGYTIYLFKRDPIIDSLNRSIIPNIGIIIEKISPKTDVVTYSVNKRANMNIDVDKTFMHGDGIINFINAVGYKGSYVDDNHLSHIVYVVHAINGDKGIQLILDTTSETFSSVDPDFLVVLKSFRLIN
jgi:hypothetical protein